MGFIRVLHRLLCLVMGCFCSDGQIILRICKEVSSLADFKQQFGRKVQHLGRNTALPSFLLRFFIRPQVIINDSQCCTIYPITPGSFYACYLFRWETRPTWKGAECYRRATVATSPSSSGQSSPRRRRGWDTTLMNCSWGL